MTLSPAQPRLHADGSVLAAARSYPMPESFSPQARQAFLDYFARGGDPALTGDIANMRAIYDRDWAGPVLARWEALYPVTMTRTVIAGVAVDIIEPATGVAADKRDQVLLSFHGGAFIIGNGGIGGRIEAIPAAALGGFRVIAVDYRQAPEARFPAATDDALAVYKALLGKYRPANIGVYGVSAGGMLAAQLTARLQVEALPRPGAIAIMAAGASRRAVSDSTHWVLGLTGGDVSAASPPSAEALAMPSYFSAADAEDRLAIPAEFDDILRLFPPTLVLSSSRDALLGMALDTFARLRTAGVDSRLYVREGFGHGYFTQAPELPETTAAWRELIEHFDRHLST